jgi:hypothetical protein
MLNLQMSLQGLMQLEEVLPHHHMNHQVILVNQVLLVFQVLNQFKAVVVVVVL